MKRRDLLTSCAGLASLVGLTAGASWPRPLLAATDASSPGPSRTTATPSEPAPFGHGDFARLSQAAAGQPTIVHLWGVSCAPCLVELPRWAAFLRQVPSLPVVFVQFDPLPLSRVSAALRRARLLAGEQRSVTGFADERLRYEIDPAWQGELPFTLLLGADASRLTFSGSADFGQLAAWWRRQVQAGNRHPRG